jgi:hypothetical protein
MPLFSCKARKLCFLLFAFFFLAAPLVAQDQWKIRHAWRARESYYERHRIPEQLVREDTARNGSHLCVNNPASFRRTRIALTSS